VKRDKNSIVLNLLTRLNAKRMIGILLGLFMVQAVFLFYVERIRLQTADGDLYELTLVNYLLHMVLSFTAIGFAIYFYIILKNRGEGSKRAQHMPLISVFLIMMISAVIATLEQVTVGHITLFTAKLLVFGLMIHIKPHHQYYIYGVPFALFIIGVFAFQHSPDILTTHIINATAAFVGVMFVSDRFYRLKYDDLFRTLELKQKNKRLETLATLDPLTNLPNRRFFEKQLTYERAIARRYETTASLLMIDIDHFKTINDSLGHDNGDRILIELSALLKKDIRESDTLARWGGEEFMILLSHTDITGAQIVAKRLNQKIEDHVFLKENTPTKLTVSIGATPLTIRDDDNFSVSYRLVDKALYEAKAKGRNQTIIKITSTD